jgi:hypothetical protein
VKGNRSHKAEKEVKLPDMQGLVDSSDEEDEGEHVVKKSCKKVSFAKWQGIDLVEYECVFPGVETAKVGGSRPAKVGFAKVKKVSQKERKNETKENYLEINNVEKTARKVGKITIDSGAEESVYPISLCEEKEIVETEASKRGYGFVAANGSKMKNYGAVKIRFQNEGKARAMNFHVTDVKKPLGAVCRIADKGNYVCFGPGESDNYIMNIESGEKIWMQRERGTYVIEMSENDEASVFTRQ